MEEVQNRFIHINPSIEKYVWKYLGKLLDMSKTLKENGVPDLEEECLNLGIPYEVPVVHIYYKYVLD